MRPKAKAAGQAVEIYRNPKIFDLLDRVAGNVERVGTLFQENFQAT